MEVVAALVAAAFFRYVRSMVKTLVVPDVHVPFEHKAHVRRMLKYVEENKPTRIVLLGDVLDFHSLTVYRQSREWQDELAVEVRAGKKFFERLRRAAGTRTSIECIEGNHEDRWNRYVEGRAPIMRLIDVEWQDHVGFPEYGIERAVDPVFVDCGAGQRVRLLHGHEVAGSSTLPGGHALKIARSLGCNVHIGHTHRLGVVSATVAGKNIFAVEGGWLGNWKSPAHKFLGVARPDWRVAFATYDSTQTTSPLPKMHVAGGRS
tara:strand:- start:697 stop:1482 length:786 start_codon:yes stop_codon:yes gene_type:complete